MKTICDKIFKYNAEDMYGPSLQNVYEQAVKAINEIGKEKLVNICEWSEGPYRIYSIWYWGEK